MILSSIEDHNRRNVSGVSFRFREEFVDPPSRFREEFVDLSCGSRKKRREKAAA
ncbi:hypothetical protein VIN30_02740 [Adlercreutzia sp. R7]|uniref:Uncharacterized protein n=1 Tax=Adlercreutzia wanghongyangiae TaxID=3111451 RepID=A0ABU6IFY9_9ACTN|nr:hypothetical protein [Adlercreutzia sp. R7]